MAARANQRPCLWYLASHGDDPSVNFFGSLAELRAEMRRQLDELGVRPPRSGERLEEVYLDAITGDGPVVWGQIDLVEYLPATVGRKLLGVMNSGAAPSRRRPVTEPKPAALRAGPPATKA